MKERNYPITTDNVKTFGGKHMILSRMVSHYSALANAKPIIDNRPPHPPVKKTPHEIKKDLFRKEEFHNVREAYKKVSSAKVHIDNKKPVTFNMKPKNCFKSVKERYEEIEHLRTLKAMSKRILSIGKMHERKKNFHDPIVNPSYFFLNSQNKRDPKNEATKLISLKNLNEKYRNLNEKARNKLLLGNSVYEAIDDVDIGNWVQKCKKNINRPKSAIQNNYKNYEKNSNLKEYDPGKFMKIHKFNRENEGEQIVKRRNKKKEEEKNKNSIKTSSKKFLNLKTKIIKGLIINQIPIYNEEEEQNGNDKSLNQFIIDVRQFIIDNNIYRDEDFDVLIEELIKKNKQKNINKSIIEKTVLDIKDDLEN